jgi:hypothetical protein
VNPVSHVTAISLAKAAVVVAKSAVAAVVAMSSANKILMLLQLRKKWRKLLKVPSSEATKLREVSAEVAEAAVVAVSAVADATTMKVATIKTMVSSSAVVTIKPKWLSKSSTAKWRRPMVATTIQTVAKSSHLLKPKIRQPVALLTWKKPNRQRATPLTASAPWTAAKATELS